MDLHQLGEWLLVGAVVCIIMAINYMRKQIAELQKIVLNAREIELVDPKQVMVISVVGAATKEDIAELLTDMLIDLEGGIDMKMDYYRKGLAATINPQKPKS